MTQDTFRDSCCLVYNVFPHKKKKKKIIIYKYIYIYIYIYIYLSHIQAIKIKQMHKKYIHENLFNLC